MQFIITHWQKFRRHMEPPDNRELLRRFDNMEKKLMAIKETVDAIRADLAGYVADVRKAMADLAAKQDELIKAAVDADNNLDATELTALWDDLKAARTEFAIPPPPPFDASGNAS